MLLIDDFLANGKALEGLIDLVQAAGAEVVGAGIVIEKGFQPGGDIIRGKGIHLESLAIVESMDDKTGEIAFPGEIIRSEGAVFSWRSFLLCMERICNGIPSCERKDEMCMNAAKIDLHLHLDGSLYLPWAVEDGSKARCCGDRVYI